MYKAIWTNTVRSLLIATVAGASWNVSPRVSGQTTATTPDLNGISLAPGEQIVETIDKATGKPVPMFDAQTKQPISGPTMSRAMQQHEMHEPVMGGEAAIGGIHSHCFGGCEPSIYATADALLMRRRTNSGFSLTPKFALGNFDYEWGGRFTLGRYIDCSEGYELVYTGVPEWSQANQRFTNPDPAFGLNTSLVAGPGIGPNALDVFENATFQRQTHASRFHSGELNRTFRGWDVIRTLVGLRYIDFDDRFHYQAINAAAPPGAATTGSLRSQVRNRMIGGQLGLDMGYPMGRKVWSMIRARGGLFINLAESDMLIGNDAGGGTLTVANRGNSTDVSGILEFGATMQYRLGQALAARAGYEFWYLVNVGTAPDQLTPVVTPALGSRPDVGDNVFFHGFVFGAELMF